MRTLAIGLGVAVLALSLGSCATMSQDQCLAGAWGEVGLADGRAGHGEGRLQSHAEACAKVGVVPDEAVYFAAREGGLRSYCVPANGFQVGRQGSSYEGVCPASVEAPFLSAYRDGQVLGAAERAVSDAASRVSSSASRAAELDDKIAAKRRECRDENLAEAERQRACDRIDELRDEREGMIAEWRRAEDDLRWAERELQDVRWRLGSLHAF
ncbi:MAG TPA: DUF2799 domain-containing protein [Brevundimonas sp.]|jgi:hypothetical protein|uniref:DUF2799 domain-containing protein n=1 Tax=Brevundimonas sp. TaxID=1871086 RepID=UPI002DEAAA91|nr:DUF2799 domain-containing protein [Brevundimonas sp.]